MHVISESGYKVTSFRYLSKLLAIARNLQEVPQFQHLETSFVPFSHNFYNIKLCTKSCNENKLPLYVLFVEITIT